ncbi:reverse transcriptase domain-containing protein [Tanacetum coccineum]
MHVWYRTGNVPGSRSQHERNQGMPRKSKSGDKPTSSRMLKMRSLNGKLASLNISMSKSAKKSLPFFKTPKRCMKKSDFQWTLEAEKAFQDMKQCIAELLIISSQCSLTSRKRLIANALLWLSRPTKSRSKLQSNGDTGFSIGACHKEVEKRTKESHNRENKSKKEWIRTKEVTPEPWTLFMDGSSCLEGSRARLILTSPKGEEFTYTLRFKFNTSNNEAEYEALVAGLRITKQMGVESLIAKVDSRLVANQINGSYKAKE